MRGASEGVASEKEGTQKRRASEKEGPTEVGEGGWLSFPNFSEQTL